MSNFVFSPSSCAFFAVSLKADYEAAQTWPADGIPVADSVFETYSGAPPAGKRRGVDSAGAPAWVWEVAPPITAAQLQASLVAAVQQFLDVEAQKMGYDSIFTAVTYADEPTVATFQAEGTALRTWRSQVWATCYALLDQVNAGTAPVPSATGLIALLPPFVMPSS